VVTGYKELLGTLYTNTTSTLVISQRDYSITRRQMDHNRMNVSALIEECKNESDIDRKIEILYSINSMLPKNQQLKIPSLITNDYVNLALYRIEEKLLVA
jgi:hypothetical protein